MTDKASKGGKGGREDKAGRDGKNGKDDQAGRDDKAGKGGPANGPDALSASLRAVTPADRQLDLEVRLVNRADRALHYIADVRATRYDPTSRILTVSLSDEGREVIPLAVGSLPTFRHVDPGSEAEIHLSVPDRIVKLSRGAPPGEIAFDTQQLSDAQEVVVEVAWADVPYYEDTRASAVQDARPPSVRWQQHVARASLRPDSKPTTKN